MSGLAVAVLGLGSIGLRHAGNFLDLGCRVTGYDPSEGGRRALADRGGRAVTTRQEALEEADAVVIASPSGHHLDDLKASVEVGCHVLIEKPLAAYDGGIADVLAAAARKGLVVAAALNMRFHPAVQQLRHALSEGRIGTVLWGRLMYSGYLPAWRLGTDYRQNYAADSKSGGVVLDVIHELDLAHHLLGAAEVVGAVGRASGTLDIPCDDMVKVLLRHESGAVSDVHMDFATPNSRREIAVGGTQGALTADLIANTVMVMNGTGRETLFAEAPNPAAPYVAEARDFLTAVTDGARPACPADEALAVLRMAIDVRRRCGFPSAGDA